VHEVNITASDASRRLDKYLLAYFCNAPQSLVYKLLRKKRIKFNGKKATGSELLANGDVIGMYLSQDTIADLRKPSSQINHDDKWLRLLDIIFEDDNLLIVNKPTGIPSHGGMKGNKTHLLARMLGYLHSSGSYPANATFTPALCNRLDVNTSGLVICGKNYQALRAVNAAFASEGSIEKTYIAVVEGELHGSKTLENHYHKNTNTNKAYITENPEYPKVITAYKSLSITSNRSLVQINPITGRSHQIRAHMASIGHPLVGDKKYGGKPDREKIGQLLHCNQITFKIPILDYPIGTTWIAEPPNWFGKINI